MSSYLKTALYKKHLDLDATLVGFGGWEMPLQYPSGIIHEHMATRKTAGLFDVSHMGRIVFRGKDSLSFLQHVLSNNAAALDPGESQYTLIPTQTGGAVDDAYLYRFKPDEYLLVVNAANKDKDLEHFQKHLAFFPDVEMQDHTLQISMISLQGPLSRNIMKETVTRGTLPDPARNRLGTVFIDGTKVLVARTGYTGEPLGFELFVDSGRAVEIWDLLMEKGAVPVGLGARDTLRLEACLPLYGHELGIDLEGKEIPVFASRLSRFAVSFSPLKGDFIGKSSLSRQYQALRRIIDQRFDDISDLPSRIMPLAVTGKGIVREGYPVFKGDRQVGYVTSGTMVPYFEPEGSGLDAAFREKPARRAVAMAFIDSKIGEGDVLETLIRNKRCACIVVPLHMSADAPPYVRSIPWDRLPDFDKAKAPAGGAGRYPALAQQLLSRALGNHTWRQTACINLIPSEMSQSYLSRLLSISDPVNRYAEHKEIRAFMGEDVFYYQGTGFIQEVERLLNQEFQRFFGCRNIESRTISGQMANTAVFSGLVDFLNRADRKSEQRRIKKIMNNHIIRGGHLSAQPMGALRDFVARDPRTEKPAVVNFPVEPDNPYKIDIEECRQIIKEHQPELVILGKSMILHKEPVAQIRALMDEFCPAGMVMYDMAHVLGLYGPYFQEPLKEGAHIVTGSTHKTYFGTQRGIIAADFDEQDPAGDLWEAIRRRTFPGSVSNHHLGTMTGLLMSAYEMNHFKDAYQKTVVSNARTFAAALKEQGLDVAGDPSISFTETHQVVVNVGYAKAAQVARELEANNIIVNYQATPEEEGFTASGALRMGVSEMTRFGMAKTDFQLLAGLMADCILRHANVKEKIVEMRQRLTEMQFCFKQSEIMDTAASLLKALK